jgi:hypothetical protein
MSTPLDVSGSTAQRYARAAGVLLLLTIIGGGFGEFYVPSTLIVPGDPTATANNLRSNAMLFRVGFAAYLLEAVCDIALTLVFFVLLRPVSPNIALLAAFFRLVSTASFVFAELFYFAGFVIARADYLKSFSADQVNSLALLAVRLYGYGAGLFMVFYGTGAVILGYLIIRSGYLPRFLGVLLGIAGVGFITRNLFFVLAPAYAYDYFLVPMMLAILTMSLWLLFKGLDVVKWEERTATRS